MKAVFENVESIKGNDSFVAYSFTVPFFKFKWHYHPEYELTLITKGNGKRIVGDSHENFIKGDLVLTGAGLPHTWASEPFKSSASAVVIQFSEEFIQNFTRYPEGNSIRELLSNSATGLFFNCKSNSPLIKLIEELPQKNKIFRITSLLEILHQLASEESIPLSSNLYSAARSQQNENRINKVCSFIQDHSSESLSVGQAAEMIHLSKSAFCKFFKRVMKTSFSDYVNEIRIANACYLLVESDKTIREIALETGFESLTYFNRVFLKKKNKTPGSFRKSLNN